jgi:hypothetical protein
VHSFIQDDKDWDDYKTEFELAYRDGDATDVICYGAGGEIEGMDGKLIFDKSAALTVYDML